MNTDRDRNHTHTPSSESLNFTAKKSLGQNFLHSPNVVGKMIHSAGIKSGDTVLEVGPGKGILTQGLLDIGARVIAVEKDDRAIDFLKEKFASISSADNGSENRSENRLSVIHEDILTFDPEKAGLKNGEYTIAANIPYYITGEFLRKFLTSPCQPTKMVIMLQKEVAKRITDVKESILSISVKAYGTPKYIATVPARHFRPIPNVDSAILFIDAINKDFFIPKDSSTEPRSYENETAEEDFFFSILKAGFAHKRKILIKNLEIIANRTILSEIWQKNGWSLTLRAENVPLGDWRKIATALSATRDR